MALRVRMDLLTQGVDFLSGGAERLLDTGGSGPAGNVVDREHGGESHGFVEIRTKDMIDGAQLFERKVLEFAALFKSSLDCLADLLVGDTRRNAAPDKVGGSGPCVHESRLRGLLHSLVTEFCGFHPSSDEWQQLQNCVGGVEEWFLRFLQILVVGERQAFQSN